jgi:stage II sporulation protein D
VKLYIFITLILLSSSLFSQQLRIGVLRDYKVERILFSYNDESYSIIADTFHFGKLEKNEFLDISLTKNNKVQLKKGVVLLGTFSKINLVGSTLKSSITLTCKTPQVKERKYQNDFEIFNSNNELFIVNLVEMNNYLAGVVESEGGGGKELDYYKVQAIMCRTYALKSIDKHQKEGFNLCDRVHCQAYHYMLRFTPKIEEAVLLTEGQILVDEHHHLAGTFFHANCGGQTTEAANVWNTNLPYLNSFRDTFCIYTKQAAWETKIPQQKWADFLVSKYNYPIYDSVFGPMIFTFNQSDRMAFYQSPSLGIPLRDLRQQFNLKSTFFSCYPDGLNVLIRGRGVGHGVGLCQEGAMRMAKYGFNYKQIGLYYFPGLKFSTVKEYLFYKQDNE